MNKDTYERLTRKKNWEWKEVMVINEGFMIVLASYLIVIILIDS